MSVLSSREKRELTEFSKAIGVTKGKLTEFVDFYNTDFSKYDNLVYNNIGSRLAHWWNFRRGGWFAQRIEHVLNEIEYILKRRPCVFLDIGFSVAYISSKKKLWSNKSLSAIFVDKEASAIQFNEILTHKLAVSYDSQSLQMDIENPDDQKTLIEITKIAVKKHVSAQVVVCASEVIEHLQHPDNFWRFLNDISKTHLDVLIYATLPIGAKIPSHNMEFLDKESVLKYLEKFIDIDKQWHLTPGKDEKSSVFLEECVCVLGRAKVSKSLKFGSLQTLNTSP